MSTAEVPNQFVEWRNCLQTEEPHRANVGLTHVQLAVNRLSVHSVALIHWAAGNFSHHCALDSTSKGTRSPVEDSGNLRSTAKMSGLSASLLIPARWRSSDATPAQSSPSWLNRQTTPVLQSLSRRAYTHPIHTIVAIALLASTSYIGLLEGSLFDSSRGLTSTTEPLDTSKLLEGGRNLYVGPRSSWKWQVDDQSMSKSHGQVRSQRRSIPNGSVLKFPECQSSCLDHVSLSGFPVLQLTAKCSIGGGDPYSRKLLCRVFTFDLEPLRSYLTRLVPCFLGTVRSSRNFSPGGANVA